MFPDSHLALDGRQWSERHPIFTVPGRGRNLQTPHLVHLHRTIRIRCCRLAPDIVNLGCLVFPNPLASWTKWRGCNLIPYCWTASSILAVEGRLNAVDGFCFYLMGPARIVPVPGSMTLAP